MWGEEGVGGYRCMCQIVYAEGPKDSLQELVLCLYHVGPGDQT